MESGFVGNDNPRMKRRTDKDIEKIKKYSKEMDQKLEDIKKQNANHCRFPVFNF